MSTHERVAVRVKIMRNVRLNRATEKPAIPIAMGLKALYDAVTAVRLAREEWQDNKKLCEYCQVGDSCMACLGCAGDAGSDQSHTQCVRSHPDGVSRRLRPDGCNCPASNARAAHQLMALYAAAVASPNPTCAASGTAAWCFGWSPAGSTIPSLGSAPKRVKFMP